FHHAPCRRRGKKHWLLCSEQRLKLWMNVAVKIPEIFAAMANQRTRKRRPGFFRNFNGPRDEKLIVRMHAATSNIEAASAKLRRGRHRTPNAKSGRLLSASPESSGSTSARQCVAGNLVCARGATQNNASPSSSPFVKGSVEEAWRYPSSSCLIT